MDFRTTLIARALADFLDAIEQGRDPHVTGNEAHATQRLIADIMAAPGWGYPRFHPSQSTTP